MEVKIVPESILSLVPKFEGDGKLLTFFIEKCDYVASVFGAPNNINQATYLYHCFSCKLTGRAAVFASECTEIKNWEALKASLIQQFGDPRTEENISIELESLKINNSESYLDFSKRIKDVLSALKAKVNLISDEGVKAAKFIIYNNNALNVFLYNLPEDMIRIVRLKNCTNLEAALSVVLEEVNFLEQYQARSKLRASMSRPTPTHSQYNLPSKPIVFQPQTSNGFRLPFTPQSNFKFGIPNANVGFNKFNNPTQNRFNMQPGFKNNMPPQQNTNFKFGNQQPQFKFGVPNQGFRYGTPQQNNMNRANAFAPYQNQNPQTNFRFGIPNQNLQRSDNRVNTDVSMRTAIAPRPYTMPTRNMNHLFYNESEFAPDYLPIDQYYCSDEDPYYMYRQDICEYESEPYYDTPYYVESPTTTTDISPDDESSKEENFPQPASKTDKRK